METRKNTATFTQLALQQLQLIFDNDQALRGEVLRLKISGKGCDGFEYHLGFSESIEGDLFLESDCPFSIVMDAFTSTYLHNAIIDYAFGLSSSSDGGHPQEGFVVVNQEEFLYKGKFWKNELTALASLPSSTP